MKTADLIQTLKIHCQKAGLSQEEMAHRIGVSMITLNRWFNGNLTKMHKATEMAIRSYLRNTGALK